MAAQAVEGAAVTALRRVIHRVRQAAERSGRDADDVRVVAVSKTKPMSLIRQVYDAGHRCFGENYVQEFIEKAPLLPQDIHWHFIGHLQSNKAKSLIAAVPNLSMVQGVDNEKIANHLDRAVSTIGRRPLPVMVQVNTSGEISKRQGGTCTKSGLSLICECYVPYVEGLMQNHYRAGGLTGSSLSIRTDRAKSGIEPSHCLDLVKHVKFSCPNLVFSGLMTIGMPDYTSTPENFKTLSRCRVEICKELGLPENQCELSMGMSGDFELAIEMGSTNVRIGSTIFGPRDYSKKQQQQ